MWTWAWLDMLEDLTQIVFFSPLLFVVVMEVVLI